jgi:Domain of unknown function (DUF4272)
MSWFRKILGKGETQPPIEKLVPIATVEIPPPDPDAVLYQDQVLRKAWAEDVLTWQGIPVNKHLPCIEGGAETVLRSAQDVTDRLLALTIVAVKGEGMEQERILEIIEDRKAWPHFSPKELAFINDPEPTEHDRVQFAWRYEAAWVMFWALNFTKGPLEPPFKICDVPLLVETVRDTDDLAKNGLHSVNNVLNEADLIYRYHWAVRQASIDGVPPPGGLEPGVVMERHYALNWLIGYLDCDWDDVSTDT